MSSEDTKTEAAGQATPSRQAAGGSTRRLFNDRPSTSRAQAPPVRGAQIFSARSVMRPLASRTHFRPTGDRFIPNRLMMDKDAVYQQLVTVRQDADFSPETRARRRDEEQRLRRQCGLQVSKRLLHFSATSAAGSSATHSDLLGCPPAGTKKGTLKLYTNRILDAPGIVIVGRENQLEPMNIAAFTWTHKIDWSADDVLAVGIQPEVWTWDKPTNQTRKAAHLLYDVVTLAWCMTPGRTHVLATATISGAVTILEMGRRAHRPVATFTDFWHSMDVHSELDELAVCLDFRPPHPNIVSDEGSLLGRGLAIGWWSGMICLVEGDNRTVRLLVQRDPSARIFALKFSPDGRFLVAGTKGHVIVLDFQNDACNKRVISVPGPIRHVMTVTWCSWHRHVFAVVPISNTIYTYKATTCERLETASSFLLNEQSNANYLVDGAFNPYSKELVVMQLDVITLWSYPNMRRTVVCRPDISDGEGITWGRVSPSGHYLAVATTGEVILIYDGFQSARTASDAGPREKSKLDGMNLLR